MSSPEVQRQFYLAMAGIQVWYARDSLPGAAPSPEFEFPEEEEPDQFADAPPAQAPVRSGGRARPNISSGQAGERIAHLQALMAGGSAAAAPQSSPADAAVVAEPQPEAESEPRAEPKANAPVEERVDLSDLRVTLGFWSTEDLVLVSGVSDDASERLQDALANNIIAALGAVRQITPSYLRWPVFANPVVPGNGFADFSRLVASMVSEQGARQLVLLGVLSDGLPEDRQTWLGRTLGAPTVDFPSTLAELAAVPSHKRALWRELKPLARGRT